MFLLATLDLPNLWHSALPPTKSHPRHQKMTPKRMSTATGRVYSWKKPMRTSVWYCMALVWPLLGNLFTGKRRKYRSFRLLCCYLQKTGVISNGFGSKKRKTQVRFGDLHIPRFFCCELPVHHRHQRNDDTTERFLKWLWIKTNPLQ